MTTYTLSPAGTAKCAVSKCDSPRHIGQPPGRNYAIDRHTKVSIAGLIEMGQAGWLCSVWIDRHIMDHQGTVAT